MKHLLAALVCVGIVSIAYGFWRICIMEDYLLFANVPCDPAVESCFVGDGENTPQFYTQVSKPAYSVPDCNAWNGECPVLGCEEGEARCQETTCDPATGEECSTKPL